ncbi:protein OSB1, mitochondrial-like isoform X2 [Prosopis cineraria]|uniref:protein OSB1, mitochondrial-like isoform X2 n=1 Tax=Prosopis cineraria TaxID=364024 RepID=UPI002410AC6E|nr:protein OSB1, mitochondrial-like isoform X2 [Prosopis cineraria]
MIFHFSQKKQCIGGKSLKHSATPVRLNDLRRGKFIKLAQSMLCLRVISHLARAILSSPQKSYRSSSSSTLNHLRNSFDNDVRAGSAVYQHALKFQRPAIIEWCEQLDNTVNLIGSVTRNPQVIYRKTGISGVHTSLRVKPSNGSSFWVLLLMWNGVGEIASKHLKQNDFIFASGHLESYEKVDERGNIQLFYKVIVKEFNFVAKRPCYAGHKRKVLASKIMKTGFTCGKCFLPILMSGGITGSASQIRSCLTLSTGILAKLCG